MQVVLSPHSRSSLGEFGMLIYWVSEWSSVVMEERCVMVQGTRLTRQICTPPFIRGNLEQTELSCEE